MINAGIGNPIIIAERFESTTVYQNTPNDILYTVNQPQDVQAAMKRYLSLLDEEFDISLEIVISPGGSTLAFAACLYAIQVLSEQTITVKSALHPPYYTLHRNVTETLNGCKWVTRGKTTVEVVTSPNNPNGELSKPTRSSKYVILDSVYDKPQFSGIYRTLNPWKREYEGTDCFCEVDSVSKIGLAGLRLGYILTRNKTLAVLANDYIETIYLGQNTWANRSFFTRYNRLLNRSLYDQVYAQLQARHEAIRKVLPRDLIQSNTRVPYIFMSIPAFLFEHIDVRVSPGTDFDTPGYSRLSIMISDRDWDELLVRLVYPEFIYDVRRFIATSETRSLCVTDNVQSHHDVSLLFGFIGAIVAFLLLVIARKKASV
jgi:aspartate/methionine/tyrosine aminotransferase